jgi:hypothetical protein
MTHRQPAPTIWPVALASGVTLFAVGLITSAVVAGAGALLVVVALVGWVRILLSEEAEA